MRFRLSSLRVRFVWLAKTKQNANLAPLANSPPQLRRFLLSSVISPRSQRGPLGGSMLCYQVLAQFTFYQHKPALVSTHIKKQKAKAFLVHSGLPFGSGLKVRRFFKTKKEAARYVSHLHAVYKNRIVLYPALPGGQQYLFQEVSK
jgi:hypothetical protein